MADSFGLMYTASDDNRVILDSEFVRMNVRYKGRYTGTEDSGNSSTNYFPAAITTQEQPLVFIRPDSAAGIIGMSSLEILGVAGNWIGFRVRIFNMYTIKPIGRWFAGTFGASPVAGFGLRLFDATGKVIFDSGMSSALFVRSTSSWTYTGSGQTGQGQSINYFNAPFTMSEDEYLMINNLTMNINTLGTEQGRTPNLMWNYPARIISMAVVGIPGYNANTIGITLMVAKINA